MTPPLPVLQLPFGAWHALPDSQRSTADELARDVRAAVASPVLAALLDAVDTALVVLGDRREIVAHNGKALDAATAAQVVGIRLGEAIGCVNATPNGCATSHDCETCGALGSILRSQEQARPVESECLIRRDDGAALELRVRATPVELSGATFTAVSLRDISAEKRRDAYEQIFFHDVLNTVAGLRGWSMRLRRTSDPEKALAAGERIDVLSKRIEREIQDHRTMVLAERGSLVADRTSVRIAALFAELEAVFASNACAEERLLELLPGPEGARLETDPALLLRVLVNMTRNALEAVPEGGRVRVSCEREPGALRLTVWNDGVIPPPVQARIFQRSFSTKAARGRGLGTYSMKLLGERHLGGEVDFLSTVEDGTSFWITLPA
jgi:signal transduction histidine kinase